MTEDVPLPRWDRTPPYPIQPCCARGCLDRVPKGQRAALMQATLRLYCTSGRQGITGHASTESGEWVCPYPLPVSPESVLHPLWRDMCHTARHAVLRHIRQAAQVQQDHEVPPIPPCVQESVSVSVTERQGNDSIRGGGREREDRVHSPTLSQTLTSVLFYEKDGEREVEESGIHVRPPSPPLRHASRPAYQPQIQEQAVTTEPPQPRPASSPAAPSRPPPPPPPPRPRPLDGSPSELDPPAPSTPVPACVPPPLTSDGCCGRGCLRQYMQFQATFNLTRLDSVGDLSPAHAATASLPQFRSSLPFFHALHALGDLKRCSLPNRLAFLHRWLGSTPPSMAESVSRSHPLRAPCDACMAHVMGCSTYIMGLVRRNFKTITEGSRDTAPPLSPRAKRSRHRLPSVSPESRVRQPLLPSGSECVDTGAVSRGDSGVDAGGVESVGVPIECVQSERVCGDTPMADGSETHKADMVTQGSESESEGESEYSSDAGCDACTLGEGAFAEAFHIGPLSDQRSDDDTHMRCETSPLYTQGYQSDVTMGESAASLGVETRHHETCRGQEKATRSDSEAQDIQETEAHLSTHVPTVSVGRVGVTLGGAVPHMCPRDPFTLLDGYTHPDYPTQEHARDAVVASLSATLAKATEYYKKKLMTRGGELKRAFVLVWLLDQDGRILLPQSHVCRLLRCTPESMSKLYSSTPAERLGKSVTREVAALVSAGGISSTDRDGVLDGYTHPDYPTQGEARKAVLTALQATLDDARQCFARGEPRRGGAMKRAFISQWLLDADGRPVFALELMSRLLRCDVRTIAKLYSPARDNETSDTTEAPNVDLRVFHMKCCPKECLRNTSHHTRQKVCDMVRQKRESEVPIGVPECLPVVRLMSTEYSMCCWRSIMILTGTTGPQSKKARDIVIDERRQHRSQRVGKRPRRKGMWT
ncbi:hypothetical protein KIPB_001908 [Kipferlia bialata]|uniref:Uncharacterized protein n=1 Tax=Kipferlia bialata TaxID=797122 RepID=A0A9K3CPL3_9EUKA|nr:hypothetical protein KIPB_001908 [Kipferlia bialata]|eukprot:g1908.t1